MIEATIADILLGHDPLTDLIGDRVWPGHGEQDSDLPFLVYSRSDEQDHAPGFSVSSLRRYEITIEVWAADYDETKAIADAVIDALDGYRDFPAVQAITLVSNADTEDQRAYPDVLTFAAYATR